MCIGRGDSLVSLYILHRPSLFLVSKNLQNPHKKREILLQNQKKNRKRSKKKTECLLVHWLPKKPVFYVIRSTSDHLGEFVISPLPYNFFLLSHSRAIDGTAEESLPTMTTHDPVPMMTTDDPVPTMTTHDPVPTMPTHDPVRTMPTHDPVPATMLWHDPVPRKHQPNGHCTIVDTNSNISFFLILPVSTPREDPGGSPLGPVRIGSPPPAGLGCP